MYATFSTSCSNYVYDAEPLVNKQFETCFFVRTFCVILVLLRMRT